MSDRIQLNINQLMLLSKEYETKVPFEHFYDTYERNLTETEVIQNIDNKIKSILQDVIDNYLDLDIAFVQMYKLILFATDDMDGLFPNSSLNHFMAYYKFFIHFLIFGCCLGTKYRKYIVLDANDADYKKSEILRYCINEFVPKVTNKHIKYKQCNKYRDSITDSLKEYVNNDVTELIADFVEFKCDEFFMTLLVFFKSWEESQVKTSKLVKRLRSWYGFESEQFSSYFIAKLLYSNKFIAINDNDKLQGQLEYFANNILLKSLSRSGKDYHYLIWYYIGTPNSIYSLILCSVSVLLFFFLFCFFFA